MAIEIERNEKRKQKISLATSDNINQNKSGLLRQIKQLEKKEAQNIVPL